MEELEKEMQIVLDAISAYENNPKDNKSYYIILSTIDGIKAFKRTITKTKLVLDFLELYNTFNINIYCPELKEEPVYISTLEKYHDCYNYYLLAGNKLKEYIKVSAKYNAYIDLKDAYLLSINGALMLNQCFAYLKYITNLGVCYSQGISYQQNIKDDPEIKENINTLVLSANNAINELKKEN
jgi:hypothetical protein